MARGLSAHFNLVPASILELLFFPSRGGESSGCNLMTEGEGKSRKRKWGDRKAGDVQTTETEWQMGFLYFSFVHLFVHRYRLSIYYVSVFILFWVSGADEVSALMKHALQHGRGVDEI